MFFWQMLPAIVGSAFQAAAVILDDYSRKEIPAFSFFLILWNITGLQYWRRKQQFFGLKWNTLGCSTKQALDDHVRFQYYGLQIQSYIDGKDTVHFPTYRRWGFYILSFILFMFSICSSLGSAGLIYYLARWRLSQSIVDPHEQWVISGGTALQIMFCNWVYYYIAMISTDWENHRMEKDFVDSLSGKICVAWICM